VRISRGWSRRTKVFGALAVAAAALFVRLGVWQLHRLEERRGRNAEIRRQLALPPVRLAAADVADGAALRRLLWRRVEVEGRFDAGGQVVVRGRTWEGTPGVGLLTPFVLSGGGRVWVDRGWVPSPDAEHVDASRYAEPGAVRVRGFLRPPGRGEESGAGPPAVVERLADPAAPRPPVPRGEPELSDGPHLSYAVQWFAFAAIALGGFTAYAGRRRARGEP
jgi:surfeit locus 1 family protein